MFQTCSRCGFDWHGRRDELCPDCRSLGRYENHPGHRWALSCTTARLAIELSKSGLKIGQVNEVEVFLNAAVRSRKPEHLEMESDEHDLQARTRGYHLVLEHALVAFNDDDWDRVLDILRLAPPPGEGMGYNNRSGRAAASA